MTAFIFPACERKPESRLWQYCVLGVCCLLSGQAGAEQTQIRNAEIVSSGSAYVLNADIEFELNSRLRDALHRGVALYFSTELKVERPRWYWLDQVVSERQLDYRLSYHTITRSYRLSIGSLHQSFDQLEPALGVMQRIRNWQVADKNMIEAGVSHEAELRFRLDTSKLPRPFQVTTIGSRDWQINTDWVKWTFLPGVAGQR